MWQTAVSAVWLFWGSFSLWRKHRHSYESADILDLFTKLGLGILAVMGIIFLAGVQLKLSWQVVTGALLGIYWMNRRLWFDGYEWLDTLAVYGFQTLVVLNLVWRGTDGWMETAWAVWGWLMTLVIGKRYRKFYWYKSGKPGLAGLVGLGWWLMGEILVAIVDPNRIYLASLVPKLVVLVLGLIATMVFVIIRANIWQPRKKDRG